MSLASDTGVVGGAFTIIGLIAGAAGRTDPGALPAADCGAQPGSEHRGDRSVANRSRVGILCLASHRRLGELLAAGLIVLERVKRLSRAGHDLHGPKAVWAQSEIRNSSTAVPDIAANFH
jgi:hypothetical protein